MDTPTRRHRFEGARAIYERVDKAHHDHIVDLDTGEIVEFQSDRIEQLQAEIAALMGFEVMHHRLELYCRKRWCAGTDVKVEHNRRYYDVR